MSSLLLVVFAVIVPALLICWGASMAATGFGIFLIVFGIVMCLFFNWLSTTF